jgi:hypothetical protein
MTTFTRDTDGIPRCQILIDGKPCNGQMLLTQDGHYLACENIHGKLFQVNSDQANLIRQTYRDRDNPSKALLNRRWKETLLVAVKVGAVTRTAYSRDKAGDVKKRVAVYKIDEAMYEVANTATQDTKTVGHEVVACMVSKSGVRSAKRFAPITLTEAQTKKLQDKVKP